MAFFKFRKGGDEHATSAPPPATESVEAMRTRARHRLIGASVLVLVGVIGFPLLFDSQPRPISVDIPIEIPDKNTVKPLGTVTQVKPATDIVVESDAGKELVAKPAAVASAVSASRASTGTVSGAASVPAKPPTKPETKPADKPVEKPAAKPAEKPADKPPVRSDDGAKAQALLEGKDLTQKPAASAAASAAATSRFIVQVGAFSDAVKAQEARVKLERAGMKTYTQVVNPAEGKRIRVRVGPFGSKGDADKVADKIRKLDLPASVLEL
ncbi:SPOR domain-containing protein [Rhodoferax sp. AJA081-3]|uniref:SPOR domain-containing protein n=1 Tax=Rhodoferax sp. AJA081-3 TaxID=2752316 RepID=UPI001AE01E93|nr:SPOR domain-containing protein [Rhodoferax sp. AJA081-3]QTN28021.1 SPOR domain-containing protein [Rhodoferax sp. AJA081-3]